MHVSLSNAQRINNGNVSALPTKQNMNWWNLLAAGLPKKPMVGLLSFLLVSSRWVSVGKNTAPKIVIFPKMSTIPLCLTWSGPPWLRGSKQGKSKPLDVSIPCAEVSHPGLEVHQEKATASSHKPTGNCSMAVVSTEQAEHFIEKEIKSR